MSINSIMSMISINFDRVDHGAGKPAPLQEL